MPRVLFLACSLGATILWARVGESKPDPAPMAPSAAASSTNETESTRYAAGTKGLDSEDADGETLKVEIERALRQLGSPDFHVRQRARETLARIGPPAWTELRKAQHHPDLEIAIQAKYLLQGLYITGPEPGDPVAAHELLDDYANQSEFVRRQRITQLARITDQATVNLLARIAQREASDRISESAALAILGRDIPHGRGEREELAAAIENGCPVGDRPATAWLRAYSNTLRQPAEFPQWWAPVLARLDQQPPDQQTDDWTYSANRLRRWYANSLWQLGRRRDAEAAWGAIRSSDPTLHGYEGLEALARAGAYRIIDKIFSASEISDVKLLYRLAELARERGMPVAETWARRAFDRTVDADHRGSIGDHLVDRKMWDWAEREFDAMLDDDPPAGMGGVYYFHHLARLRRAQGEIAAACRAYDKALAIPDAEPGTPQSNLFHRVLIGTRIEYSEALHDQGRDQQAAEVLAPLTLRDDATDSTLADVADEYQINVAARRHFFLSEHFLQQQERELQKEQLRIGFEKDPEEIDLLIAIYQLSDRASEWRVEAAIRRAAATRRATIRKLETYLRQPSPRQDDQLDQYRTLARELNIYAWLIANTEGDYHDALRCSQRSLQLHPDNPGYLDTLARCHYALGQFGEALRFQEEAVSFDPYSGQMNRQHADFRNAWEDAASPPYVRRRIN